MEHDLRSVLVSYDKQASAHSPAGHVILQLTRYPELHPPMLQEETAERERTERERRQKLKQKARNKERTAKERAAAEREASEREAHTWQEAEAKQREEEAAVERWGCQFGVAVRPAWSNAVTRQ